MTVFRKPEAWLSWSAEIRRRGRKSERFSFGLVFTALLLAALYCGVCCRCQSADSSGAVVTDSDSDNGTAFTCRQSQQTSTAGGGGNDSGLAADNTAHDDDDAGTADDTAEKLGRIQFTLGYDFEQSTLTLKIIRAVDLAAKDITGRSDPYVKVMLLPDKKHKLLTNIKRRNLNPRWNEVFAFEGLLRSYLSPGFSSKVFVVMCTSS